MNDPGHKTIIETEIWERRILHGLACEWENALWILPVPYREKMRPPLFRLQDRHDLWGAWWGGKREISLSRSLVWNHSWGAVREVLFHEMAHQLAEEGLGARTESPHGPQFQRACHLLRANPQASGDYPPLDERLSRESLRSEDRILRKVQKLLALAESPNQNEAEAAMTKAHHLIFQHNRSLLRREFHREYISIFVGKPALRHFLEDYSLAHLLQDFYFVQGIWVSSFILEKSKMGRVLEISGTAQNVQFASYVHDFVKGFIQAQWREYNRGKDLNRYRLTDFAVGILEGFRSKLESKPEKSEKVNEASALVKSKDPLLKKYLSYRYPHTVMLPAGRGRQDWKVREDGRRVGRKLVIAKGMTAGAKIRGFQIQSEF